MKVKWDCFKPSGKWYAGGVADVGEALIWHENFREVLNNAQDELTRIDDCFTIVVDNVEDNDPFAKHVFYGDRK